MRVRVGIQPRMRQVSMRDEDEVDGRRCTAEEFAKENTFSMDIMQTI